MIQKPSLRQRLYAARNAAINLSVLILVVWLLGGIWSPLRFLEPFAIAEIVLSIVVLEFCFPISDKTVFSRGYWHGSGTPGLNKVIANGKRAE